jgi:Uma2 family endonuclease
MAVVTNQLKTPIIYPDSDGAPIAESDPARDYLIYGVEALSIYFQNRPDVYVSGNLYIYYKKGVPSAVIAPDVFVVFGVEKKKRLSYKVWEENNRVPSFVLEITSLTTQENDQQEKPLKYAKMGVEEYFQYDPTGDYLEGQLKGSRLVEEAYQPLPKKVLAEGVVSIKSQVLGLDLRLREGELRFYEPKSGQKLLSYQEMEQARQQAELERQQAELERQQAQQAWQQAELERQQAQQALQQAVPRLRNLGLSVEQIGQTLDLSPEEVRQKLME